VKPLDSSDGAEGSAAIEPDGSLVSRIAPSAPILAEPDAADEDAAQRDTSGGDAEEAGAADGGAEGDTPRADALGDATPGVAAPENTPPEDNPPENTAEAAREPPLVVPSRVSLVVPVGTLDVTSGAERVEPREDAPPARASEIVPVDPAVRRARAAFRQSEFGETLHGTGFSAEDDEEATTVDAGAALAEEEQLALMRRIQSAMGQSAMRHSAMEETAPYGTPAPEPVQPMGATPGLEHDARSSFKHTMLLGLPQLRPQPPSGTPASASSEPAASPSDSAASAPSAPAEPALLASLVRVVGPPTQPPPRRVRRPGSASPDSVNEPDHEAFVLTHPLAPPDARRSNVPGVPSAPGALVPGSLVAASGAPISLRGPGSSGPGSSGPGSSGPGSSGPATIGGTFSNGVAGTGHGSHDLGNGAAGPPSARAAGHAGAGPTSAAGGRTSLGAAGGANGGYGSAGYGNAGYGDVGYHEPASGSTGDGSVSRGSMPPQLMLPPPPRPQDYEPASSPVASRFGAGSVAPPPLRASIEVPATMRRTRPPASRPSAAPPPPLHDLPTADPFAGFVAPPPSFAQRGLVVVVVALAVVGVCALVAIAFGLLGKTGW